LVLASTVGSSRAAAPAKDDKAAAKAHYAKATELYRQANYREAIESFKSAYKARPHGVIFYNLAQCYEKLGEVERALKSYEQYLGAVPNADDKATVVAAMDLLKKRLATLAVATPPTPTARPPVVAPPPIPLPAPPPIIFLPPPPPILPRVTLQTLRAASTPTGAAVAVDGEARGTTPLETRLPSGPHKLSFSLEGHAPRAESIVMGSDKALTVEVRLEPLKKPRLWSWVALGVAGAAMGVGTGFGLAAKSASNELLARKHEHDEAQGLHDAVLSRAQAANVLYGVGGGAVAVGGALFFFEERF
jgi:hypothetical protein